MFLGKKTTQSCTPCVTQVSLVRLTTLYIIGEEVRWTNWGILSGLFWVPAACCGIYGIRNAGLAIAVGIWSSMNVIMSMLWGILIFQERFDSLLHTSMAFSILIFGLVGMSRYSKPPAPTISAKTHDDEEATVDSSDDILEDSSTGAASRRKYLLSEGNSNNNRPPGSANLSEELKDLFPKKTKSERIILLGGRLALTRRQLGIVGAAVNGTWGGLNLVPLHFAKREGFGGAAYLISFACGSMIVNTCLWIFYYGYYLHQRRFDFREALYCLPEWHLEQLWLPGFLAGSLYSLGNFGSILSVTYLGQGVGFSLCQVQILVSGLWGIFYYKEIKGRDIITKWLISACIAVVGILWLSHEHSGSAGHRRLLQVIG